MQHGYELNAATGTMASGGKYKSRFLHTAFLNDTPARAAPLSAIAMALAAPALAQLIEQTWNMKLHDRNIKYKADANVGSLKHYVHINVHINESEPP